MWKDWILQTTTAGGLHIESNGDKALDAHTLSGIGKGRRRRKPRKTKAAAEALLSAAVEALVAAAEVSLMIAKRKKLEGNKPML